MWNTNFHCSPPNQKLCIAKTKSRFMNMVSIILKHVLWAYCFYSVLNIFRVLNTNHKLNDLTSKATTLKGLHFISIPHSAARCEKQLRWINISVFTCKHIQVAFLVFLELCSDFSRGTDGLQESRIGPLCLKWHFTESLQNVFKTTKAFYVISLNVYFLKIQICNKTICIKIKLLLICH